MSLAIASINVAGCDCCANTDCWIPYESLQFRWASGPYAGDLYETYIRPHPEWSQIYGSALCEWASGEGNPFQSSVVADSSTEGPWSSAEILGDVWLQTYDASLEDPVLGEYEDVVFFGPDNLICTVGPAQYPPNVPW